MILIATSTLFGLQIAFHTLENAPFPILFCSLYSAAAVGQVNGTDGELPELTEDLSIINQFLVETGINNLIVIMLRINET
mmetsp:Transcript_24690/g.46008  ORF Transcript_24690/g.46008 Transcript_24690/m.46008 type:complete len:80 (-) Transcript_24690:125-364(-)